MPVEKHLLKILARGAEIVLVTYLIIFIGISSNPEDNLGDKDASVFIISVSVIGHKNVELLLTASIYL